MARADLTFGGTSNVATSYSTSDPITPGLNRLVLAFVVNQSLDPGQLVAVPTLVGNGLNWDQVETITLAAAPERRLTCFRAMGANPTAGALNFSFGGQEQTLCGWSVFEYDGVDRGGGNGAGAVHQHWTQSVSGIGLSVTLGPLAEAASSTLAGAVVLQGDQPVDPGAGLTEIHEIILQDGVACTLETQDRQGGGQSVDWSWAGADDAAAIVLEIKAMPAPETLEELARRFEPILYFHTQERFIPSDAKRYVEKCSLYRAQAPFDSKSSWGGIGAPFPRKPIPFFGANEIAAVTDEPGSLLGNGASAGVPTEERFFELDGWKDAGGGVEPFVTQATKNTYANRESVFMLYNSPVGQGGDQELIDSKFWYHAELLDTETLRTALRTVSVPELTRVFESLKNPALLNYYFFYPAHEETLASCTNTEANEVASFAGEWSCLAILLTLDETTGKFDPRFIGYTGHVLPGGTIAAADPMDPAARIVMRVNPFTDAKPIDEHPQLYVAKGTHSLYLDPGTIPLDYPAGLATFSCGRFETPPPPEKGHEGLLDHPTVFLAKLVAGGSLLNPIGAGLIGTGIGAVAALAEHPPFQTFGPSASPDLLAPDVTGAAGSALVAKPKNVQLPADGSTYHDWQVDNIEINGRRYGFLVDRTKQKWWPTDIGTGGAYNGRWGPRVNNDPTGRRAGMSFPPFWRMFFLSLAAI